MALGVVPLALYLSGSSRWPLGVLLGVEALLLSSLGSPLALAALALAAALAAAALPLPLPQLPSPGLYLPALCLCYAGCARAVASMGGVGSWGEAVIVLQTVCLGAAWFVAELLQPSAAAAATHLPAHHQQLYSAAWACLGSACLLALLVLLCAAPCAGCGVRPRGAPLAATQAAALERQALLQRLGSAQQQQQAAQLLSSQWWGAKGTLAAGQGLCTAVCAALPGRQAELFSLQGLLRHTFEELRAAGTPLQRQPGMAPLQLLGALEGSLPALQRAGPTALLLAAATLTSALLLLALNTAFATPNCAAHVLTAVLGNAGGLHPHAAQLVALWAALLLGALAAMPSTPALAAATRLPHNGANLLLRKAYHALGVAILLPGLLLSPPLLAFALGGAVYALTLLELARALRLQPLALHTALHEAFSRHTDSRECTALYLTHFYLLLGMGLPLMLVTGGGSGEGQGQGQGQQLRVLEAASGLLALGVGDAAAAVAGTLASAALGKAACLPWEDVKCMLLGRPGRGAGGVTVLGSAAFVVSVLGVGYALLAVVGGGRGCRCRRWQPCWPLHCWALQWRQPLAAWTMQWCPSMPGLQCGGCARGARGGCARART